MSADRLISYLKHMGQASYTPPKVYDDGFDYGEITFRTKVSIADNLQKLINQELTPANGVEAHIEFIDIQVHDDQHRTYKAVIIPYQDPKAMTQRDLEKVTDAYLRRLPKVLRNIRQKY